MTDRLLVIGAAVTVIGVTLGIAFVWLPLAIVVGSLLTGGMMVAAAVLIAASNRSRGPEA